MTKKLNDASPADWDRARQHYLDELVEHEIACPPSEKEDWDYRHNSPSETMTFNDYVSRERANFYAAMEELDWVDNIRPDNVNHPDHYNQGGIECIDYIKQQLGDTFDAYCQGNVIKYLHRWRYKNGLEDLRKAQWYLNAMVTAVEEIGE